jgi:Flp pilus assembly protein CpaB
MTTQRIFIIVLALATLVAGVVAAVYWWRSSCQDAILSTEPDASISDSPEQYILTAVVNLNTVQAALAEAGSLNRTAAAWSGIAALLGAITTVVGVF